MVLLHDFHAQSTHLSFGAIVQPAIIKDQFHVVHEVLNASILVFFKLCLDCGKVHRVFHNHRIVINLEFLVIDRVSENVCLLVPLKSGQEPLRGFLPLVKNWCALGNFWHLKIAYGMQILTIFISFKVLCDFRIGPFELFKLLIGHWRVKSTLPKLCEHVSARDFALIFHGFWLRRGNHLLDRTSIVLRPTWVSRSRSSRVKQKRQNLFSILLFGPT